MQFPKNKILVLLALLCINNAFAYAPVESRNFDFPSDPQPSANSSAFPVENETPMYTAEKDSTPVQQSSFSSSKASQSELYAEMQRMAQELRELRGQLEVQDHTIKQLQEAQRNQYLDLEQRLTAGKEIKSSSSIASTAATHKAEAKNAFVQNETKPSQHSLEEEGTLAKPTALSSNEEKSSEPLKTKQSIADEQKIYQTAYNFLKNKQYSQAIPSMQSYLEQFPKGEYSVNAHYWLGELYLLTANSTDARKEFQTVIDGFPESSKVSEALLKIGLLDYDEGDYVSARDYLNQVSKKYPNSPAARLAEQKLQQIAMQTN